MINYKSTCKRKLQNLFILYAKSKLSKSKTNHTFLIRLVKFKLINYVKLSIYLFFDTLLVMIFNIHLFRKYKIYILLYLN